MDRYKRVGRAISEKQQKDIFGSMKARWLKMEYKILASCSSGNAVIIKDIVLIDCGVAFKRLEKYYKKLKIVLLTHIHSLRPL